jgi:cell division protein FtsB
VRILVVALLLLLGWLQYRLWVGEGSLAEVTALRREIKAQEAEIEILRERNRRLLAEVEDLRQGLDALEERARSELGMIKEGELFLQVIESAVPLAGGADPGVKGGGSAPTPPGRAAANAVVAPKPAQPAGKQAGTSAGAPVGKQAGTSASSPADKAAGMPAGKPAPPAGAPKP